MPRIRKRLNDCPFVKRDGTVCRKRVEGAFCATHKSSQQAKFASSQKPAEPEPQVVPETPKAKNEKPFSFEELSPDQREKVQEYARYVMSV